MSLIADICCVLHIVSYPVQSWVSLPDDASAAASTARRTRRGPPRTAWVTRLVARYRLEGDAAFEARSRRPRTSPTVIPAEMVELAVNLRSELSAQGLDAGPHTVCWHLQQRYQIAVSPSMIRCRFVDLGLVKPNPKQRPRPPMSGSRPICPEVPQASGTLGLFRGLLVGCWG